MKIVFIRLFFVCFYIKDVNKYLLDSVYSILSVKM